MNKRIILAVSAAIFAFVFKAWCQEPSDVAFKSSSANMTMTLDEAICMAQNHSLSAMQAKYTFLSQYWSYRSYKASRLPSLNLSGTFMSFDRSLRLLQDYNTGEMRYLENYNLQNSLGISISQQVGFTGGTLQVYSSLNRLDQFGHEKSKSYYSQPVTLSYSQPLFAYNAFRWSRKIEPKQFELSKRQYIENMERITLQAVQYYFRLVLSRMRHDIAATNYRNTKSLYSIAENRLSLGSITKDELLQLELRMLNDSLSINTTELSMREQQMSLNSFLRLTENTNVHPVLDDVIPEIDIDYEMVMDKIMSNSSFNLGNEISMLNADADVARAKAQRGATASINARFGLSQTGDEFRTAYANLVDQEVVGLQFSLPIFDWGMGKGRVRMAKARADIVRSQIEQAEVDYRREVYTELEQFRNQRNQCSVARMARDVADRRYTIAMDNFRNGKISVTDLNTAQSERDQAVQTYVSALSSFWESYYELRRKALYDFITHTDITAEFDKLIDN